MRHFKTGKRGIAVELSAEERLFLGDVLPLLAGLGSVGVDPAATRLQVPVYLDDPESNEEWWRLMGEELNEARRSDRAVFQRVVGSPDVEVISHEEGDALVRVLNEARLALGARFGLEVEEDHDRLPEESRAVLDFLGWIQEELTTELMR
jgi:hypothetical protein